MGWKDDKNLGPWEFAPQLNKWGYLNNPRWLDPPSTPVSYDGREDEEPQVWDIESGSNIADKISLPMHTHVPCGHWHKPVAIPGTPPPTTPAPLGYLPWLSCPQAVIWIGNDVWYVTTDNENPLSTMFVLKYSGGIWSTIYTVTRSFATQWREPEIDIHTRNGITVIGLMRYDDTESFYELDIFTFNGEALINRVQISDTIDLNGNIFVDIYHCRWVYIDSTGIIHILVNFIDNDTGFETVYDFRSTDNGAIFNPVSIMTELYGGSSFIREDGSGDLWIYTDDGYTFKSVNNGSTWAAVNAGYELNNTFEYFISGSIHLAVDYINASTCRIMRSTDTLSWSIVQTAGGWLRNATMCSDGTYLYCILSYQTGLLTNTNEVYRSANSGTTWTLVNTFSDEETREGTAHLFYSAGNGLVYTHYYAETVLVGSPGVYMMTLWISNNLGVTWTPVQTPFYDLTTGIAP
jgi:hypothetical protein